jgi:hypothetical protein
MLCCGEDASSGGINPPAFFVWGIMVDFGGKDYMGRRGNTAYRGGSICIDRADVAAPPYIPFNSPAMGTWRGQYLALCCEPY